MPRLTMKVAGRPLLVAHREVDATVTQADLDVAADEAAEKLAGKAARRGVDARDGAQTRVGPMTKADRLDSKLSDEREE